MDENRTEKEIRTQTGKGRNSNPNWKRNSEEAEKKYGRNFASLLLGIEKMKPS